MIMNYDKVNNSKIPNSSRYVENFHTFLPQDVNLPLAFPIVNKCKLTYILSSTIPHPDGCKMYTKDNIRYLHYADIPTILTTRILLAPHLHT